MYIIPPDGLYDIPPRILQSEIKSLQAALKLAIAALRQVGDDYPGSSCHKWCHDKADEAEKAL